MKAEHAAPHPPGNDPVGHEQKLAAALGALVQQVDIGEYRDRLSHSLKNNTAFIHAQAIVDEFGVSHADICKVLDTCGGDMGHAARSLKGLGRDVADPCDRPPEYKTWTTGP